MLDQFAAEKNVPERSANQAVSPAVNVVEPDIEGGHEDVALGIDGRPDWFSHSSDTNVRP